ncbi:MAG: FtsX-like permease family protein, partial [Ruminococcus sp.]|nr:FtsX-like permease family protein [Ruminococcus sp.]
LMDGENLSKDGEIILDRLYAENNDIHLGDRFSAGDMDFKVVGVAAFSDYSALFKNNTDMMFDANKFTVCMVSENDFAALGESGLEYEYAWLNNDDSLSDDSQKELADDIMKELAVSSGKYGNTIKDFVARQDNQAIQFTGNDMGGDAVMMRTLLYIVIVVLSFAFAVTIRSTIEQEAAVIGTLRASGYTKGELLGHYLALPALITAAGAVAGNIIGYTAMKFVVADMYYHSYSLPTYKTLWNPSAFISTTVIPILIILFINFIIIGHSLSLSPLQFIRRDLSKRRKKRAVKLPNWKFLSRFRTRVILQNIPAYCILFLGIFLATVLLMFGLLFSPLLSHFKDQVVEAKFSEYQYILKAPLPTETAGAEKYCVTTLVNDHEEEITVYGIQENSYYLKDESFSSGDVFLSEGYMEKYGVKTGNTVTLNDKYSGKEYDFKISDRYDYPPMLCVFMNMDDFNRMFGNDEGYFSGYFSNEKLTDIDDTMIASVITEHDLTVMADQLEDSVGMIFPMIGGFAALVYILMIYLLAKIIVEKNESSISMIKILGYTDNEASKLYNRATSIVVIISLLLTIPLSLLIIKLIYYTMMLEYSGWLTFWIAPWIAPAMFIIGGLCYTVVSVILLRKIKKIPLSQALKNME